MTTIRSFTVTLTLWIVALTAAIAATVVSVLQPNPQWVLVLVLAGLAVWVAARLFHYVNDTNRRLARFFESVRYSDFAIRFASEKEKGASFTAVNQQFNEVLEAFRQTRAEKEANLLFLNTIVQHLSAGILVFDAQFGVLVSNNAAFQLLGVYRLHHVHDLPAKHNALADFVQNMKAKGKMLYQPDNNRQLAVQGVTMSLQGRAVRMLTLQDIHPELQRKEVDAWRNLTRVLRHEIMNSITPIVSLVETAQEIVQHDLPKNEASADLTEALEVVATRSRGLVNFVEAYRSFSAVPQPRIVEFSVKELFNRVVQLAQSETKDTNIVIQHAVQPDDLLLKADAGQLEMVLLNLIKNAREAFMISATNQPIITLLAGVDAKNKLFMEVSDNGPGIAVELLDEVFIPFFTTKPMGTGIGLSISKQIIQLHGGDIRITSAPDGGTRFVLEFS
jgi:two-component system, NtrC family, nitrogen regulation sensor histidine kinase NtrY